MDDMESKINSILNNPQMMQQLMSMAQAIGQTQNEPAKQETPVSVPSMPQSAPSLPSGMDINMLQKIYGIARQSGIDKNQQALLKALGPYLNRDRIVKLEKAMRAAKIAGVAATALSSTGSSFFSGR